LIRPFFVFLSAVKLYTDLRHLARVFLEKFSEKQKFRRNLSPCGKSFPRKLRKHTVYNRYYFLYNEENAQLRTKLGFIAQPKPSPLGKALRLRR
jgi:hypothetical protein